MKKLSFLLSFLFAISCNKQPEQAASPAPQKCTSCYTEIAFPNLPGKPVTFDYRGEKITLTLKGEHFILGGDIVLSKEQVTILKDSTKDNARTGTGTLAALWPGRTVYYTINPNLPNPWRVSDAITHWQQKTNLVFVQRSTQPNYIEFVPGEGCSSSLGMTGGRQLIILGDCITGSVIHEIGHAIGFYHEQTRSDRDKFITVNFANILATWEDQFKTYSALGRSGFELGEFDFNSIMLYSSFAASKNNLPTMVKKDGSTFIGQRYGLSTGDIETYNQMYNLPYITIELTNKRVINTPYERGTIADAYLKLYTDATKTTPYNPTWNLEVFYHHTVGPYDGPTTTSVFKHYFPLGTNTYELGQVHTLTRLQGTRATSISEYSILYHMR